METYTLPTYNDVQKLFDRYSEKEQNLILDRVSALTESGISDDQVLSALEQDSEMSALDELMAMTGLDEVKEAVMSQVNYHKIMRMRRIAGRKTPRRLMHMLLTGNPGTGKTTVARLIGRIFKQEGILSSGHLIEANRASLIDKWIGGTEEKVTEILNSARGGILFIDEIYSLVEADGNQTSTRDFGMKVIDTLMPRLSDPDSEVMIIGAGYTSSIRSFLNANPGLASRFPLVLEFRDFTIDELMIIAVSELQKHDFELCPEAHAGLRKLLDEAVKVKDHGNARLVMTIINNHMIPNMCNRLAKNTNLEQLDIDQTGRIMPEDLPSFHALFPLQDRGRHTIGFTR